MSQGEQKLSAIEAKVDRGLQDVRQSQQDVIERQEKKNEALMKEIQLEIQLLKKVYCIINSYITLIIDTGQIINLTT